MMRFPFCAAGTVNVLRYQPVPPVVNPPPTWLIAALLKGDELPGKSSMLQSCGRSIFRHPESSNFTFSAPCAPPRKKIQLSSNKTVEVVWADAPPHSNSNKLTRRIFLSILLSVVKVTEVVMVTGGCNGYSG